MRQSPGCNKDSPSTLPVYIDDRSWRPGSSFDLFSPHNQIARSIYLAAMALGRLPPDAGPKSLTLDLIPGLSTQRSSGEYDGCRRRSSWSLPSTHNQIIRQGTYTVLYFIYLKVLPVWCNPLFLLFGYIYFVSRKTKRIVHVNCLNLKSMLGPKFWIETLMNSDSRAIFF